METARQLLTLNWPQLIVLGGIVLLFLKKETWLERARKDGRSNVAWMRWMMTAVIVLAGLGIILLGDLHLAVERSAHRDELNRISTEIRTLQAEVDRSNDE